MIRVNRDTVIAIVLLMACGILLTASFDIREPDYGVLSPAIWPRIIVTILSVLSLIYLVQSIRKGVAEESSQTDSPRNAAEFLAHWRNVFWVFALFLAYLLTMPYLGMLLGGLAFVFLLLNALGGWQPRQIVLHGVIALVTVGGMWSLFTFGLHVRLPPGEILGYF